MITRRTPLFYGWWVALAFGVLVFLSTGIRFTVGPFLKPVVADLNLDRATFSLVIAVCFFLYGAFMPFVGYVVDRWGPRVVTIVGAILLAGSVAATGLATSLWQLYLLYGVLASLGLAATGPVVGAAVLSRWFVRHRVTALSILSGASTGGMSLLVPLATWLILTIGWRAAYGMVGLTVMLVAMPLALWVIREPTESDEPTGNGRGETAQQVQQALTGRIHSGSAFKTLPFWQLCAGLFTCGFSMGLLASHGVPMLTDHGYHPMVASWALALLGLTSLAFAMALGALADRFGCRPVLAGIYGGRALALLGLFLIRDHPAALLVLAVVGGVTMAGAVAMTSALTANIFGAASVGSIFGMIFFGHQTGAALSSWLAGFFFELTGGYAPIFTLTTGLLVGAVIVTLAIDEVAQPLGRLAPAAEPR